MNKYDNTELQKGSCTSVSVFGSVESGKNAAHCATLNSVK